MLRSEVSMLIILLLLSSFAYIISEKRKQILFLATKVEFNSSYLHKHTFQITKNRTSLDVQLNVAHDLEQDPWTELTIGWRESKQKTFRTLFSYDINVCQLLGRNGNGNFKIVDAWFDNFWKYGTMPKECPIKQGNYFWHDLRVEQGSLPSFLLTGKYRAYINTYFREGKRISLANLTIYFLLK